MNTALLQVSYHVNAANHAGRKRTDRLPTHNITRAVQQQLTHQGVPQKPLQVCKKSLQPAQQGSSVVSNYVDEARRMLREMVRRETRGPGDTNNALRRIARRNDLPYGTLWAIKYRPPKGVFWDVFERLRAAYQAECIRQAHALQREIAATRDLVADHTDRPALQQASARVYAVLGEEEEDSLPF